jgi:hypothetical protein
VRWAAGVSVTRHCSEASFGGIPSCRLVISVRAAALAGPRAGVPKDGNRVDQRFHTGSLVVEGRFELTPLG